MHLLLACCILIGLTAGEVIDLKHACQEMREILMCDGQGDTKYTYAYSSRNDIINRLVFSGLVDGLIDLENLPSVETVSALSSKLNCENLKGLGHDVMIYDSSSEIHCSHVTEVTTTSAAVAVTTNPHVITVEEHTTNHDSAINHEPTSEILPNQTIKVLHSLTSSSSKPPATSNPSTTPDSFQTDIDVKQDEDTEREDVINENTELLIDIAKLCNRKDRDGVENIFLLGKSGAGKSALVNTLIKVIAGKYIPKAKVGAGVTQSKTLTLQRYTSCGVRKADITDSYQRDLVLRMLPRLPTILDAAGNCDINTAALREIIELIIGGYIPPGTSIEALEDLQKRHYVGALKEIVYTEARPEWKVTKVVYVHSCRDVVLKNLVECLHSVLKTTDPKTAQPLYTGDVFVVITKYDMVKDQSRYDCGSDDQTVTMEEFMNVEETVAKVFNIEGALEDNRIRWVSYTDLGSRDNPFIDNIALKFIKRMVQPGSPTIETVGPILTPAIKMKLEASTWWRGQNISIGNLAIVILAVIIAIWFVKLLTAPL